MMLPSFREVHAMKLGKLTSLVLALGLVAASIHLLGQQRPPNREWTTYGGDLSNTHYSPLDQINKDNFNKLEVAWRFKADALGPRPEYNWESTPLMANGMIYVTAGSRRDVVGLDAETGEMLWMYSINEGKRGDAAPRKLSGRGLAYYSDGRGDNRVIYVTPGYQLVALDAKTGHPILTFGDKGIVDLKMNDDQVMDPITGEIGLHATPVVAKNTIIVGAAHLPGGVPKSRQNEKGYIRGFDVKTGKRMWIFHTIPQLGEPGIETWEKESWVYTGNAGVWGQISVDEELNTVYLPVELPTGDYYGGHRPGANLYGETVVAVDLTTGKKKWHYQLVHHGIWDFDIPCAPILIDINVNGRAIKALAQPPTQPFPTKPPAYDTQGTSEADLIDWTPEIKAEALKVAARYKLGPLFTPPVVSTWPAPLATLMLPSAGGGSNWFGGSFDPETKMLYTFSVKTPTALGLVKSDGTRSDMNYISGTARDPSAPAPTGRGRAGAPAAGGGEAGTPGVAAPAPVNQAAAEGGGGGNLTVMGLPLFKPPYGRITAFDMNKGDIVWQIAHGETPDNIKNHPALKGITIPKTGRNGRIGTLVTKTLLVAGEGGFFTTPNGQRGAMLRAYDKASGNEVGSVYMAAPQSGTPMTYMLNGKQYIVLAISGGSYTGELVAYRLPS